MRVLTFVKVGNSEVEVWFADLLDFIHNNLDGLLGSEKLDHVLNLVFSKTTVTETRTINGDSERTDHVIDVDSRTSETNDRGVDKKDSTADRKDGKHVTDDRKVGDGSRQPSTESAKEEVSTRQTMDEGTKKTKPPKPRYLKADITNKADNRIRMELDQADEALEKVSGIYSDADTTILLYLDLWTCFVQQPMIPM